jgi:hypothetical protein
MAKCTPESRRDGARTPAQVVSLHRGFRLAHDLRTIFPGGPHTTGYNTGMDFRTHIERHRGLPTRKPLREAGPAA